MGQNGEMEHSRRIQVRFVTKLRPPMKIPPTSIAIPSHLTRMGLSKVVNDLLKAGNPDWEPHPFDFIINDELVRMSLEEFLLAKGISAEKTLEIEYIKAVVPRREEDPCLHDDWVSAVSGANPRYILTGSYDNLGRVWEAGGLCTHILEGHRDAITSVTMFNPKGSESVTNLCMATASKDHTLRLWKCDAEEPKKLPVQIGPYKILKGHTSSVQSVAARPSGDMVCSGSWDCTINLWQTNESVADEDSISIKKRKVNTNAKESLVEGKPVSSIVGHTQCVNAVVWPQHDTIYSASWDHSIRRWDTETGQESMNVFTGKALNCLDVGGDGSAMVAAGGSDPVLRIWDPRKPGTLAPIFKFSSHTSWISACKWHERSMFHLLSASYDGKVMLWDLRTAWPVSEIESHKDKVLCADWWKGDSVVSGGADTKLCISGGIFI